MATPAPSALVELLKPITWFAPMWAFTCGVVSSGASPSGQWPVIAAGVILAGPLVCATSQAVNDWYDRHVDAINEPHRPIPSGRMPGRWGLYVAFGWTLLSLLVAAALGPWILGAALFGLVLAWIYSAPPLRLKRNGWWGNTAVALCYEGLPWFTGAAVMAAAVPDWRVLLVALLYSVGAHGIMTLNDFKSVEGDGRTGIRSLPVQLGTLGAARLACLVMAVPQVAVILGLFAWNRLWHGTVIGVLLLGQFVLMRRLLAAPRERAAWYNGTGTTLYVLGMLVAAFALRPLVQGGP
ncbi:bacteriochlorophyll/chlorophyll a synthase [Methylobacterium sp. Leaf104]|uniref:chlorophyll synthase ChlG n=1 Tax=Methylobacterium TaxID=407 RepID=UPI000700FF76|nr:MULTISPECIES: chlorophyll synthase ChlG [Methylobacterium]KQP42888.1 bacteriochlorophyll/chlorophyll a synthase [Methylobacterium sp. Leaf104]MCI9878514.1 chlorophyll synthase ChlG [Methylobacterium goesingense]